MSGFVYILAGHIKIYRIYLNDLVAKLNQNKLQKIENRTEIGKTERGRETLPSAHMRPSKPAQSTSPCQSFPSSRQEDRGTHPTCATTRSATSCLLAAAGVSPEHHAIPRNPSLSSSPSFPSSVSFSHAPPNTPTAAVRRCRNHCRPDDAPSRSRAPAPRHQPPHRATRPKEPRSAAPMFSPSSATEDRRRQIRRRSSFPELAVHPTVIYVSF